MQFSTEVKLTVNGKAVLTKVEARHLLVHVIRDELRLTGTHIGCDTSQCGACAVLIDGEAVKSCTVLAVQAAGSDIQTIEGIAPFGELGAIQRAFHNCHALQCGYCTPGMIISVHELLRRNPSPNEHEIREALHGNLCRCTGYHNIVAAVLEAASEIRATPDVQKEPA